MIMNKEVAGFDIKPMETDTEIKGKAFVHWRCWQETYPGLVSQTYLNAMTLAVCEKNAFQWRKNTLVAKDRNRVIGFVSYGDGGTDASDTGEVVALYVLPEYQGVGVGMRLLDRALKALSDYRKVCLWVVKGNERAIRFYEKNGFRMDGIDKFSPSLSATGLRMVKIC